MIRWLKKGFPTIRLCDLAKPSKEGVRVIENKTFKSRRIIGPAVLYCPPDGNVALEGCSLSGNPDAILCPYEGKYVPVGAIVLRNVTFKDCDLKNVSILGRSDEIARMKLGLRVAIFEEETEKGTMLESADNAEFPWWE